MLIIDSLGVAVMEETLWIAVIVHSWLQHAFMLERRPGMRSWVIRNLKCLPLRKRQKIIQLGLGFKSVELEGKYLSSGVKKGKDVKSLTLTVGWCLSLESESYWARSMMRFSLFLPRNYANSLYHMQSGNWLAVLLCIHSNIPLDSKSLSLWGSASWRDPFNSPFRV